MVAVIQGLYIVLFLYQVHWGSVAEWLLIYSYSLQFIHRAQTSPKDAIGCAIRWHAVATCPFAGRNSARLAINRLRVQIPAAALPSATLDKLFTHTCFCYQAVLIWYRHKLGR